MRQATKIDGSLNERRAVLDLLRRLGSESISFQEMEQIGSRLSLSGGRALKPLLRELERETSGELITRYAYMLDFFETQSWLEQLIRITLQRPDIGEDGRAALLVTLEGYGVDVHTPPFKGQNAGGKGPLFPGVQGEMRLGEEGIVNFLDDFLNYPPDVQKIVIRELSAAGDTQATRMLEAILWYEDQEIVRAALTALGRIADPQAAGVLARYLEDGRPDLGSSAQRSLRRLAFLGIVPPPARPRLPFHAGFASVPDGDGYRSLLVSRWVEEGKLALLYMQVHERRGLLAAWGAEGLAPERFEAELEAFGVQDELHEVHPGYVLKLLKDALYQSSDLCYLPADYYMRRGMFAGEDLTPAPYRPLFPEHPRGRGLSYRAGEEISRELLTDPFFYGWFIAEQRVYAFAEEYRRGGESERVLERFCAELIAPELEAIRERLLLSADLLRRCGRDRRFVGRVVALAESIKDNPLPIHLHPFLRDYALESMAIAKESLAQREVEELQAVEDL